MKADNIRVVSINISRKTGTIKKPVGVASINKSGVIGDAHSGTWHRQVSLLSQEIIEKFSRQMGRKIKPGEFAENITSSGLDLDRVGLMDRFKIGNVELEVTQIGKDCHRDKCAIFVELGKCVMPKQGIFCRVIRPGTIKTGDNIMFQKKYLKFLVITLSDRAASGEYRDESGKIIKKQVADFFKDSRWQINIESLVLPDNKYKLKKALKKVQNIMDVVITTGGTGLGPRDITPEVVGSLCTKQMPGIMEHIRTKYGSKYPNALLSRGIAGVMGKTFVYTLPGNPKAVKEYLFEIFKSLEHSIMMVHGLGH